jgi:Uma2 family endonuclease
MAVAATLAEKARPITRADYDRMVDAGLFHEERVELWRGVIVEMSPQKSPHAAAVESLNPILVMALVASKRAKVRIQLPFALSDDSEPEPDVAVVPFEDHRRAHPHRAFFIIEVADASLEDDRGWKAGEYASAGVPEYWVVNVRHDVIEVYTDIIAGRYTRVTPYRRGATISPAAFPDVVVKVDDVLG